MDERAIIKQGHNTHTEDLKICYVLFTIIIIVWHILMREYGNDSVTYFSKIFGTDKLINILMNRYDTWTSRVIIEAVLFPISTNVLIWKICNILMYILFIYSILCLTNYKYYKITFCLLLNYPIIEMSSAGWIATYVNYFWPLSAGTYALTSLHKIYSDRKIHKIEYLSYSLATLFATNAEQVDIFFICVLFEFGFYYYFKKKRKNGIIIFILLETITFLNLLVIVLCDGNYLRSWAETGNSMHDFGSFSVFDKAILGVTDTMNRMNSGNLTYLFFTFLIFVFGMLEDTQIIIVQNRLYNIIIKVSYCLPFTFAAIFTIFKNSTSTYFYEMNELLTNDLKINAENWNNFNSYIPFIIYTLLIINIIISILNIFNNTEHGVRVASAFMIGILTRIAMGFSPTLYASGMRTFIFLEAVLIYCIAEMCTNCETLINNIPHKVKRYLLYGFTMCTILSIINNTISICNMV